MGELMISEWAQVFHTYRTPPYAPASDKVEYLDQRLATCELESFGKHLSMTSPSTCTSSLVLAIWPMGSTARVVVAAWGSQLSRLVPSCGYVG